MLVLEGYVGVGTHCSGVDRHLVAVDVDGVTDRANPVSRCLQASLTLGIANEDITRVQFGRQVVTRLQQRVYTHDAADHLQAESRILDRAQRT